MADSKFKNQQIFIDRRPIWIVLFDRLRRYIVLALFFGIFALLLTQEGPSDLSPEGYKVLCLFFLCVSLWSTNLIPLSITSLLAIAAVPLLGIMDASQAYSYFGNKAVFFILGVFILSASMIACGLSTRISFWVMEHWSETPGRLVTATYCFAGISSCFMSEHAVAQGIPPRAADRAIRQLFRASGEMLAEDPPEAADHVRQMLDYAGTTAAGLQVLEDSPLSGLISEALNAAAQKARDMRP